MSFRIPKDPVDAWYVASLFYYDALTGHLAWKSMTSKGRPRRIKRTLRIQGGTYPDTTVAWACAFGEWPIGGRVWYVDAASGSLAVANLTITKPKGKQKGRVRRTAQPPVTPLVEESF